MDVAGSHKVTLSGHHGRTETEDEHARRVAGNEAVFRHVNEQIERLNHVFAAAGEETIQIICECGDLTCADMVSVPIAEFESVRSEATLFFVIAGHEDAAVEDVVYPENGPYRVVRKHPGPAREVPHAADPRAADGAVALSAEGLTAC